MKSVAVGMHVYFGIVSSSIESKQIYNCLAWQEAKYQKEVLVM
jgi:hypothetical protein